jgi:ABC-type histidine transport system ATPase subunit
VANRVMLFHKGLVAEDCPPEKFFNEPDNQQVQEFLSHLIS